MPIPRTSTSEFIANTKSNIFNEQNSDDEYDEIDYDEGASLPSSSSSFDYDDDDYIVDNNYTTEWSYDEELGEYVHDGPFDEYLDYGPQFNTEDAYC